MIRLSSCNLLTPVGGTWKTNKLGRSNERWLKSSKLRDVSSTKNNPTLPNMLCATFRDLEPQNCNMQAWWPVGGLVLRSYSLLHKNISDLQRSYFNQKCKTNPVTSILKSVTACATTCSKSGIFSFSQKREVFFSIITIRKYLQQTLTKYSWTL